jgi:very-short-patch-repair endonuclease
MTAETFETDLRTVARAQQGVFTLSQALESGLTRPVVRRKLARHEWEEVAPRVYRAAVSGPLDWRQLQMAVVLASGGISSGRSAAALYGLVPPPPRPEVTLARAPRGQIAATFRTSAELPELDRTEIDGIPVTTPARTLVDLGGVLPLATFEDVLDTAIVRRLVTIDRLRCRAEDLWTPRRNGCAVVVRLLRERGPQSARAANRWEARVLQTVRRLGLPTPMVNHRVRVGGQVRYLDLAWPEVKVAVEFDGFVPHSTRRVFDDDRVRQNDLVADGWTVFRVTKVMLTNAPQRTFAPIVAAVTSRSSAVWNMSVPN